jgi:hypothetical protein
MRTFIAVLGVIGVFVSDTAFAQAAADGQPSATTPPPAETTPPPAVAAPVNLAAPAPFGQTGGPSGPSLWGILPWGGYGIGARYMMPLPITQLLTRTKFRDYWALEFGADIMHWNYDYGFGTTGFNYSWTEVVPVVGMMWQVWFTENFAAYPKIEVGYAFGWYSDTNGVNTGLSGGNRFFPDGTAGVLYKLGNLTLRAEAGYVGGKAGVAWLF